MTLPFKPPLSPHEQAIYASLPKLNGAVVHPQWAPIHERARLERQFLEWCSEHQRSDWPQWLNDWEIHYRLSHRTPEAPAGSAGDVDGRVRADAERQPVAG